MWSLLSESGNIRQMSFLKSWLVMFANVYYFVLINRCAETNWLANIMRYVRRLERTQTAEQSSSHRTHEVKILTVRLECIFLMIVEWHFENVLPEWRYELPHKRSLITFMTSLFGDCTILIRIGGHPECPTSVRLICGLFNSCTSSRQHRSSNQSY